MPEFSLYPYNQYILYAMIVITIVCLIAMFRHLLSLGKTVAGLKPELDAIQNKVALANTKMTAVQKKREADKKKNKWMNIAVPLVLATYKIYKNNDDLEGISGYRSAFMTSINNQFIKKK